MDCIDDSTGVLTIGVYSEEHLAIFDGVRVLGEYFLDDAIEFGFDLVHDLHRLDDAEDLSLRNPVPHAEVRPRSRLWSRVVRSDHRRLHLEISWLRSFGSRRRRRWSRNSRGSGSSRNGSRLNHWALTF